MKAIVNINAYLKVLETLWNKRGWNLVAEDAWLPRTDGKGTIYYQRSSFDPRFIQDNPRNWPMSVYALVHEADHNQEFQAPIFKYMRDNEINMLSLSGACFNLLWDELNDRRSLVCTDLTKRGRVVFCEDKWSKVNEKPKSFGHAIMNTVFVWDCINRTSWNDQLFPYVRKVYDRPTDTENDWLDKMLAADYYDRLVDLSINHDKERGERLWTLTLDILKDVFDYEVKEGKEEGLKRPPPGEGGRPCDGGEKGEMKETTASTEDAQKSDSSEENVKADVTKSSEAKEGKDEENQGVIEIDYEELLVAPHVSEADVRKMDTISSERLRIDYSNYKGRREYRYYAFNEFTVVDLENDEVKYGEKR